MCYAIVEEIAHKSICIFDCFVMLLCFHFWHLENKSLFFFNLISNLITYFVKSFTKFQPNLSFTLARHIVEVQHSRVFFSLIFVYESFVKNIAFAKKKKNGLVTKPQCRDSRIFLMLWFHVKTFLMPFLKLNSQRVHETIKIAAFDSH